MNNIRYLKASFNTLRFGALGGMLLHLRDRRTVFFQCMQAAILVLMVCPDCVSAEPKNEKQKQAINLAPGSAHPGTTGEVKLELEDFFLEVTLMRVGSFGMSRLTNRKANCLFYVNPRESEGWAKCESLIEAARTREPSCRLIRPCRNQTSRTFARRS